MSESRGRDSKASFEYARPHVSQNGTGASSVHSGASLDRFGLWERSLRLRRGDDSAGKGSVKWWQDGMLRKATAGTKREGPESLAVAVWEEAHSDQTIELT